MTNTARWELTIPAVPPTLNHCTRRGKNNLYFPSPEYEDFKIEVMCEMMRQHGAVYLLIPRRDGTKIVASDTWPEEAHLMVEITFYSPKVFKKRSDVLSRGWGDVDNRIKPLFDSIFTPLGRNDVHVKSVTATKEHGDEDRTEILIEWEI
jgi:Holliday junction resolvase RusA-like endonuclease